jgi:hypothetical protein
MLSDSPRPSSARRHQCTQAAAAGALTAALAHAHRSRPPAASSHAATPPGPTSHASLRSSRLTTRPTLTPSTTSPCLCPHHRARSTCAAPASWLAPRTPPCHSSPTPCGMPRPAPSQLWRCARTAAGWCPAHARAQQASPPGRSSWCAQVRGDMHRAAGLRCWEHGVVLCAGRAWHDVA